MIDNDEWGNIELPGFGDDKLLDPNLNRKLAAQEVTKRPSWKKNNLEAITKPDIAKIKSDATKQQWANGREDAVENIREASTKKWKDPEYIRRQQIGRAKSGQYTDPTKTANYKGAHIGTCIKTGKETIYHSPQDLKDAGLSPGNVYNCVNGKRKTTGGQTWRRVES
jgi:hypothetical protein